MMALQRAGEEDWSRTSIGPCGGLALPLSYLFKVTVSPICHRYPGLQGYSGLPIYGPRVEEYHRVTDLALMPSSHPCGTR